MFECLSCIKRGHILYDYRVTLWNGYWFIATCERCGRHFYLKPHIGDEYNPNHDGSRMNIVDERTKKHLGIQNNSYYLGYKRGKEERKRIKIER